MIGRSRWDEQIGFHANDAIPNRILFHQFENHLLAADDKANITYVSVLIASLCLQLAHSIVSNSVYDWEKNQKINRFANGSSPGVAITTLRFVNEDDIALLLTGSGKSLHCFARLSDSLTHCLE